MSGSTSASWRGSPTSRACRSRRPGSTGRRRSTTTAKTLKGRPFYYFAYGAAVSEVAIDTLTGENRLLRVDILHDVGTSLNPAIDLGQVEGGFMQGMGWLTTEELWWNDNGRLMTHAPSTYKIPVAADVPADFNVKLWESRRATPRTAIHRSKAVGEPPLMLAISVFHAITDAVARSPVTRMPSAQRARDARGSTPRSRPKKLSVRDASSRAPQARPERRTASERMARSTLQRLRSDAGAAVAVTVASVKGSMPREPGAKMIVAIDALHGTIGGGHLEYQAIALRARACSRRRRRARDAALALGANLGQCCGGAVNCCCDRSTQRPPG